MKRKFLAVLTALAVLTMGSMTTFAASPTVGTTEAPVSTQQALTAVEPVATPAAYVSVTTVSAGYNVSAVSTTTVQAAAVAVQNNLLNNVAAIGYRLGNVELVNAAANPGSKVTASILTVVDLKASTASKDAYGNYVVTMTVPGISEGDAIAILHYTGKAWETIVPTSTANGIVTFTSASLSPISVVKLSTTGVTLSPKTGSSLPVAAVILVIGVVGMAVSGKRYFA
ncbi:MAG: hypothetical protein HDR12_03855 [Lachnospiraceae bacterium]|nr:hypothetical protein [Lachnospiraceae bacterium]